MDLNSKINNQDANAVVYSKSADSSESEKYIKPDCESRLSETRRTK